MRDLTNDVYVGNLSYRTTELELVELFQPHGEVSAVRLLSTADATPAGAGFVTMPDPDARVAAIAALHESRLRGRKIIVRPGRKGLSRAKTSK